jgi:hypothetical protein
VDAGVSPPKFKWISYRSEAAADFFQRLLIGLCINIMGAKHPSLRIEELALIPGHLAPPRDAFSRLGANYLTSTRLGLFDRERIAVMTMKKSHGH